MIIKVVLLITVIVIASGLTRDLYHMAFRKW